MMSSAIGPLSEHMATILQAITEILPDLWVFLFEPLLEIGYIRQLSI
jgi:hypothetical protein